MTLLKNKDYFVADSHVVLRSEPKPKGGAENHLLFGDWLRFLGDEQNGWSKVRCRGDEGWLKTSSITPNRALEVNFVDIGQGDGCHIVTPDDQVILIDAGIGDNMFRFLNWRYNLRRRKVAGVDGVMAGDPQAQPPFRIDHVVISHPDKDHYYGFQNVFDSPKFAVQTVYHNGIVERPISAKDPGLKYFSGDDLGGYVKDSSGAHYLWDVVLTNAAMQQLIKGNQGTTKQYLQTLAKAVQNNKNVKFVALNADCGSVDGFGAGSPVELKVLGPLIEKVTHQNKSRPGLVKLGDEGVTKNGHSVILQLRIGQLKIMLGGDLNTESEDYLLRHYSETNKDTSKLESKCHSLQSKGNSLTPAERQSLAEVETELKAIIAKGRGHFQADITKACHHGSHHFSETFLQILNSVATIVSSGDEESYAHPRPDALGAFGKYGRGIRPLIFSTELARNTREFTPVLKFFQELQNYQTRIAAASSESEKKKLKTEMEGRKDRNVAVYGMITLRTDGKKVVIAQKLEIPSRKDKKWDIHELRHNPHLDQFEYQMSNKGH